MSLETLLEAARFLELQEQLNSNTTTGIRPPTLSSPSTTSSSSSSSSSSDAYHLNNRSNFVNNNHNHNNNNNSVSSSISNNNSSTNLNNNINQNNISNSSNYSSNTSRSNHRSRHHYNSEYRRGGRSITITSTSSPPISPVNSSNTNSSLLVNGGAFNNSHSNIGGGGGSVTMTPSSSAGSNNIGTSIIAGAIGSNNKSSHSLGEVVASVYDFHSRNRQDIRNASINGTNNGRNSEEPCKNGEHPITSSSSYLLISAGNETVSSSTTINTTAALSKRDNKATSSDGLSHHNNSCKKVISNGNRVEINNKCLSNSDQMLPSLQSTSSSASAFNAGYPPGGSSNRLLVTPSSRSPVSSYAPPPSKIKKPTPLTPPPTSSRKLVEITRTRSSSLSSTNFAANVGTGASLASTACVSSPGVGAAQPTSIGLPSIVAAATIPSVSDGTSLIHSRMASVASGNGHVLANSGTEDSSQSSLNLSSSGYLSGSSANSSVGVSSSLSNLNISNSSPSPLTSAGLSNLNGFGPNEHQVPGQGAAQTTSGRRRTTSTNSGGGKQRSPCILRAGTREVHNKLEKHRRAHLKECFEQLKVQLQLRDEEKKKTSNLAILGAAYRHVMSLKKKERDLEQQVEQLAKEKINYQKRILNLKRELAAKQDNFDFPSIMADNDNAIVQGERDNLSDTLSSTRGSARYSSSSSLSSAATVPSPSGSGSGCLVQNMSPHDITSPVIMAASTSTLNTSSPSSHHHQTLLHHQQLPKSISPVATIGHSVPLSLTTKSLQLRGSPTPSTPSPSSSSVNGIPPTSPIVSSSASPSSTSTSSLCASPPTIVPQSPLGVLGPSTNAPTPVPISLKISNVPNGVKVTQPGSIILSSSQHLPPSSSPLSSSSNLSIIASTTNNSPGLILSAVSSSTTSPSILNYAANENNSILSSASLATTTTINSGMPLNLNASASPSHVQILHATTAKDLSGGKNGICRKPNDLHEQSISTSIVAAPQSQSFSSGSVASASEIILASNASTTTTIATKDKISEDSEQPKFINVLNSNTMGLVLSQISPMFAASPQSLRMLGTGSLATIELSTSQVQSQIRSHPLSSPTSTATPTTGAQLHKLLVSGTTVSTSSGPITTNCIGGIGNGVIGGGGVGNGSTSSAAGTTVSSELARLPGGAEVNLLSRNGKMTIVNNGITLKGADGSNGRAAMHVVAPLQSGGTSISRLAPLVVSQGKVANNLAAHLIGPSSQLPRQVNFSVGGQLPIISTPYLTSPMVVAVANNQTQPTLSSVPPTATSVAVATATANGSVS